MVVDCLTNRLGLEPILSISVNLTVPVTETGMETVHVNRPLHLSYCPCPGPGPVKVSTQYEYNVINII